MIIERIKEYLDYKGISIAAFERSIGMSNASFGKSLKNKGAIGTDKLENILTAYKDIAPSWLLTGEGPMLKSSPSATSISSDLPKSSPSPASSSPSILSKEEKERASVRTAKIRKQPEDRRRGIPLIPLSATAGAFTSDISVMGYECERYEVPSFEGADFLIPVKGDSMLPTYLSGDLVACQKMSLSDIFFQWNKAYVLNTDQGALIKRVRQGSDQQHILLVSDNATYPPFELPISALHAIALVRGFIRME